MRILANENIPLAAVEALRARGHDVLWALTDMQGSTDTAVLERATRDQRLVVTQDKDFGELAFHSKLPAASGIILFRLETASPAETASKIVAALESRSDWAGVFAVVEAAMVRLRPLPNPHP